MAPKACGRSRQGPCRKALILFSCDVMHLRATFIYGHSATVGAAQLPSFEKLFGFSESKAAFTDRPRDIRRTR